MARSRFRDCLTSAVNGELASGFTALPDRWVFYVSTSIGVMTNLLLDRRLMAMVGYVVATIVLWISSLVVYRRWFHPLSKIPGPFFASITHFYIVKFNLFSGRSQFYLQIEKLHQKYGM